MIEDGCQQELSTRMKRERGKRATGTIYTRTTATISFTRPSSPVAMIPVSISTINPTITFETRSDRVVFELPFRVCQFKQSSFMTTMGEGRICSCEWPTMFLVTSNSTRPVSRVFRTSVYLVERNEWIYGLLLTLHVWISHTTIEERGVVATNHPGLFHFWDYIDTRALGDITLIFTFGQGFCWPDGRLCAMRNQPPVHSKTTSILTLTTTSIHSFHPSSHTSSGRINNSCTGQKSREKTTITNIDGFDWSFPTVTDPAITAGSIMIKTTKSINYS